MKLAYCPIGKFVFSHSEALRYKLALHEMLERLNIPFCSLEGVLPDGIVRSQSDVNTVVEHFRKENVQGVFMPHCNFGTEGAVGHIASKLGVPVLLWGPRDEAPLADGTRLRDSLCGLLASSGVLRKLGIPFTYIENCEIIDPKLEKGILDFAGAINVADVFRRGIKIAHIGQRIDFFWSTIINESELLSRFNVEIQPVDMVEFIKSAKSRACSNRSLYMDELAGLRKDIDIEGFDTDEPLLNILAVRDEMLSIAEGLGVEGLAIQDFMSLVDEMGAYCFYSNSAVSDRYAVGCESDIHGAISCVIANRVAMGNSASFLADMTIRHPERDNGVLVWHAGAPLSMQHPDSRVRLGHHWILPSPLSGMPHFRLKDGPLTLLRFDAANGDYLLAAGEAESTDGPYTQNNYVWAEVNDWPTWERQLIDGPFIHHMAMVYGHYADALNEACKYIPGLKSVQLGK